MLYQSLLLSLFLLDSKSSDFFHSLLPLRRAISTIIRVPTSAVRGIVTAQYIQKYSLRIEVPEVAVQLNIGIAKSVFYD
jgi:hypothetical protein